MKLFCSLRCIELSIDNIYKQITSNLHMHTSRACAKEYCQTMSSGRSEFSFAGTCSLYMCLDCYLGKQGSSYAQKNLSNQFFCVSLLLYALALGHSQEPGGGVAGVGGT